MHKYLLPLIFGFISACAGQNPTTASKAASSSRDSYQSGTKLSCMTAKSQTFLDLAIDDVGDEEGTVDINDGGAPKTLKADYRNGRFVFGDATVHLPAPQSAEWVIGQAHLNGSDETLVCQIGKVASRPVPAALESRSAFACVGPESQTFYDLKIIDVGDQSGEVDVNDGGAPQHLSAFYDSGRFVFGNSAIQLDQPVAYEWTTGKTTNVNGLSEAIVCKGATYE